jgi:hypothetical protein
MNAKLISDLLQTYQASPHVALEQFSHFPLLERAEIRNELRDWGEQYFDTRQLCKQFLADIQETEYVRYLKAIQETEYARYLNSGFILHYGGNKEE